MPRSAPRIFLLSTATILAAACGASEEPVRASVVANFTVPRTLLDKAKQLDLRVLEGQVSCDEATGATSLPAGAAGARELVKKSLSSTGCAANVRFCGDVAVERSTATRVFEASAREANGNVLAQGCTSAAIDQNAATIAIAMFRFLAPSICGDGLLQPTEQCEPGGTEGCDSACQSTEIRLTVGASGNNTADGNVGDKTDAFFLWPTASGDAGRFLALFTDRAVPNGNVEVGLRVMKDDLSPVTTPPALASGSIFLPNGGSFPPSPAPRAQSQPQAAMLGGKYYVVFQDADSPGSSGIDIHLRALNGLFQSEQPATPLYINGDANGEANIQTAPSIAASADRLLVVWQDDGQGTIVGRTLTPPSTLGNQNQLSTGNGNARPRVVATDKGWVTVWTSDTGIKLRAVNADGTPSGSEIPVNEGGGGASGAQVASLPDGRFAVVWSKGGDIFFQRFDARAVPVPGDQAEPLNDIVRDGDQTQPAIAATSAAGGAFVVAWHDGSSGRIRARFLGGQAGFLFNSVNGQATEFEASRADGRTRAAPVVAIGGNVGGEAAVAIGWEDTTPKTPGIMVRRFPLPAQ